MDQWQADTMLHTLTELDHAGVDEIPQVDEGMVIA